MEWGTTSLCLRLCHVQLCAGGWWLLAEGEVVCPCLSNASYHVSFPIDSAFAFVFALALTFDFALAFALAFTLVPLFCAASQ